MATAQSIIERALRKAGQLGIGEPVSLVMLEMALPLLTDLFTTWITGGMFGSATDVITTTDLTAGENEIIRRDGLAALSIIMPDTIDDATDRPPKDRSFIVQVDPLTNTTLTFMYDRFAGRWINILDMAADTEAPLVRSIGADGMASCLALAIAEETGVELSPLVLRSAGRFKTMLSLNPAADRGEVSYF